jgi:hypothetical protein
MSTSNVRSTSVLLFSVWMLACSAHKVEITVHTYIELPTRTLTEPMPIVLPPRCPHETVGIIHRSDVEFPERDHMKQHKLAARSRKIRKTRTIAATPDPRRGRRVVVADWGEVGFSRTVSRQSAHLDQ